MRQFNLTLNKVTPLVEDLSKKEDFYQQCTELADFVLDGYKCQLETTVRNEDRQKSILKLYEKDRSELINALLTAKCYEEAASLAEKYMEFNVLVKICELTNDNQKLEHYMDFFAEQNFSKFVFDW